MARNNSSRQFEDLSSFTSSAEYRRYNRVKRKKRHTGAKAAIIVLCCFCMIIGGGMLYVTQYLLGGMTTTTITKDKDALGIVSDVETNPEIKNIALFGVDSRDSDMKGLSDVIMILSVDEIHNKVKMTSILRDSRVYIGDEAYTATGYDKINAAYSIGGPELALKVLNSNFKLDITDYATVNFGKTAAIVDAFGGVDLELSTEECEQTNKNLRDLLGQEGDASGITDADYIAEQDGVVHLSGNAAVAYARIRYIDSDTYRAGRQQKVLVALADKLQNVSVTDLPNLIKQCASLTETSVDTSTLLGFVSFITGNFTVERITVPGEYENPEGGTFYEDYDSGSWEWKYDLDVAADHIHEFIYEDLYDSTGDYTSESTDESTETNDSEETDYYSDNTDNGY